MDKYENYFEVTEDLYCEALKKMIPAARYVIYAIAVVILGVSAFFMFIGKNYQTGILWIILALVLAFYGFYGITFKAKRNYRRQIPSLCDKEGKFWKRTSFSEKKIKVTEPNTSASFDYSDILGVNETKNLYIIMLKDKQLLLIKKDCFKDASNAEFIDFLKEKCGVNDN